MQMHLPLNAKQNVLAGLSHMEVEESRNKHGSNVITKKKRKTFLAQYLASFGDPIIKILLIALAINVIFLFRHSDWYESAGIAIAVLLATLISTLSEYGSESAFEKLQQESSAIKCRVRRNNALLLLPISELVVGDTVLLQAGERIPADGHIVSGRLSIDQSALNGETKETRKYHDPSESAKKNDLLSHNYLFQGSVVCEGEGVMVIDKVGDHTFYGMLAIEVQEDSIESPLKIRLQQLAETISRLGYTAAIIVAVANLFNAFVIDSHFRQAEFLAKITNLPFVMSTLMNTFTLAITVIVMAVPEGLPMMITVVLSANMKKMLKDNVLVRKLVGIETAGSLNILFTDKTGTLTEGQLLVTTFLTGKGTHYDTTAALKKSPALFSAVMTGCLYNTDAAVSNEKQKRVIGGNATDRALLEYTMPYQAEFNDVDLLSHTPFDSGKKYSSSQINQYGRKSYLIKGAPEIVLARCAFYLDENGVKKPFQRSILQREMQKMGERAVRMLALAYDDSSASLSSSGSSAVKSNSLILVGVIGIRDEIRKESRPAIRQITNAGIQTVMITGDNRETAVAIAKEVGLIDTVSHKNAVFTSTDLSEMSDDHIKLILPDIRVIARAMPSDKSRLVRLAQEMGFVAGMTGDGINDAPALKKADVGFSMGGGTEVAKEAGDIVIVDNNIGSIAKAILYGRTIFKSIRKFIIFQLSMNFCAVGLSVICPFLGIDAPLTVMQMLWVNMIMDTLAGLAFSGEAALPEYMKEPPKKRDEAIMNRYMYSQILFAGIYTTIMCVLFLKLPLSQDLFRFGNGTNYFMSAFFTLFIFMGIFNSLNARTYRINILSHIYANLPFLIIMFLICVIQILMIYYGGSVFRTVGIRVRDLQIIILFAATIVPADMLRKKWIRRKGHVEFV